MKAPIRCTNEDFDLALGSSKGLAFLNWVGGWSVKAGFIFFLVMNLV